MTDELQDVRVPPHSPEIESAVLSAWSLSDKFGKAYKPEPELFHVPTNRHIASAMAKLPVENRDEASLLAQLDSDGTLAGVGRAAVFQVLNCAPSEASDPWKHVAQLREYKSLRDMLNAVQLATAQAYCDKSLGGLVAQLQDAMRSGSSGLGTTVYTERDLFVTVAQDMMSGVQRRKVSTGLPSLDRDIGGYFGKTVTVFGAATSFGKTSYSLYLYDTAVAAGHRVLIVSHEDPRELYARRLLARRARVHASALRDNTVKEGAEWSRVLGAAEKAGRLPFFIEAIGWSAERTATEIACVCASEDIALVEVDYLQAARSAKRQQDRRTEMGYIARVYTDAIKTSVSGAAGVLYSQLRRLAQGEAPSKYALKEAGELENGAENVIIGYPDKEGKPMLRLEKGKDGAAGNEYPMAWNSVWCGFEGELLDGHIASGAHDYETPEAQDWHNNERDDI